MCPHSCEISHVKAQLRLRMFSSPLCSTALVTAFGKLIYKAPPIQKNFPFQKINAAELLSIPLIPTPSSLTIMWRRKKGKNLILSAFRHSNPLHSKVYKQILLPDYNWWEICLIYWSHGEVAFKISNSFELQFEVAFKISNNLNCNLKLNGNPSELLSSASQLWVFQLESD